MDRRDASERRDLLAYFERYAHGQGRSVRRAERWRRRGWSFPRIATEAKRVAGLLKEARVDPGERVALYVSDGPLWHAAFFGVLGRGAIAVPLDVTLEPQRLGEIATELELAGWCADPELPDLDLDLPKVQLDWRAGVADGSPSRRPVAPSPGDEHDWPADDPGRVAQIVLTSGTSGAPKAVPITHANLLAVLGALDAGVARHRRWIRLAPPLRIAVALPLSHLYGQVMGVFVPAILPADVAFLAPMPAAEMARAIRRERVWALATVPHTLALLAEHLRAEGIRAWGEEGFEKQLADAATRPWWRRRLAFRRLHHLLGRRLVAVVSGGAALDPELEAFWRTLGYALVQGYGLTETAPLVTLEHPFDARPGSLGRPLPGVEVRIAPDHEILVRGANVAPARLGGAAVDEEGWLHTGDLGRLEEGRLAYLGRKGERIVTPAGVNVDPEPIVARLKAHPGALDAVVLERPWGAPGAVCAVVAARPGAEIDEIVREVNEELPDAARIRAWRVWPEPDFPRTRTGKPRRPEIRAWLEASGPAPRDARVTAEIAPPTDPVSAVIALAAEVAGVPPDQLSPDDVLGDVLTSLERVDLATRLEATYAATLGLEAFAGERTLREVAEESLGSTAERAHATAHELAEPTARAPSAGAADLPPVTRPLGPAGTTRAAVREAPWRHALPVRALRPVVREVLVRAFWHPAIGARAAGLERLGGLKPPFLMAANHLSILDPLAVLFALPYRLRRRLAPAAMWEHFVQSRGGLWQYRLAVLGLDMIPLVQVGDWRSTLRVAGELADRGKGTLVFPEGERSLGELLPFRQGIALMARELHLPIVPCALMGTLAVMPRGARWFSHCWIGRAPVAVQVGEPLPAPRPDDDLRALVEELERRIERLRQEALAAAGRA